jgi:hypothetical protein
MGAKEENLAQQSAIATLTAAIVAKLERQVSMADVLRIHTDVTFSLFPVPGNGRYEAWKRDFKADATYT